MAKKVKIPCEFRICFQLIFLISQLFFHFIHPFRRLLDFRTTESVTFSALCTFNIKCDFKSSRLMPFMLSRMEYLLLFNLLYVHRLPTVYHSPIIIVVVIIAALAIQRHILRSNPNRAVREGALVDPVCRYDRFSIIVDVRTTSANIILAFKFTKLSAHFMQNTFDVQMCVARINK